jgi:acetyl esterase/lipase
LHPFSLIVLLAAIAWIVCRIRGVTEIRAFEDGLEQANIPAQISIYEGQPHAFVTIVENIQRGGAQGQVWNQVLDFFKTNLRGASSSRRDATSVVVADAIDWNYWLMLVYEHSMGSGGHY